MKVLSAKIERLAERKINKLILSLRWGTASSLSAEEGAAAVG